ncbi:MAG: LysM peptidoglycan-binding domain-containing protein [Phycisphaerales bacterium]|nr:LysM peptidoglycan-binding domain-containing protein [Phycisphaerales bacterium]
MTREHKLAVVLGFGLLLFVGILVSDHFSATQRRGAADLAANTQIREVRPAMPISIQTIGTVNQTAIGGLPADQEQAGGDTIALPAGILPSNDRANAAVGVPAELYVLKEGETLYKLCQTRYGNGNLWKELADFNKGTISNPTKLRKGTTIRLPSASVLRGEVEVQSPVQTTNTQQVMVQGPVQPASVAGGEYAIQKGDTLGAIAARELGSSKKWELIFDANRDRLKSPSDLKIGTSLRIPRVG